MIIDDMREVLQAAKDGKVIEHRRKWIDGDDWEVNRAPNWDFAHYEYRIKPEILPYSSAREVKRDKWLKSKISGILYKIEAICYDGGRPIRINGEWRTLEELFKEYEYEEGDPCGKKVDE